MKELRGERLGGEKVEVTRTLPKGIGDDSRQQREALGQEEFHGALMRSSADTGLAGAVQHTALRGDVEKKENSLLDSRAEGGKPEGKLGMGRIALATTVPAIGADDHGTPAAAENLGLPEKGSRVNPQAVVDQDVSPKNFDQLMSMARLKLSELESERMQNTVEDTSPMADDLFPIPLPLDPWPKSNMAVADMIYGLNKYASGRGDGPRPNREPCGVVENLGKLCERFKVWEEPMGRLNFKDFSQRGE